MGPFSWNYSIASTFRYVNYARHQHESMYIWYIYIYWVHNTVARTLQGPAWASWYRNSMSPMSWWVMQHLQNSNLQCSVQVDTMDQSLSNSTLMGPLNTTDSSPCTRHLSSLARLTLVHSDCLPSCSLWCRRCSLASEAICLSHSVDSLVLSCTVRSPPSQPNFASVHSI